MFTLSIEQYEALISLARRGTTGDQTVQLEEFLRGIEKSNGVTRHVLLVQWQEPGEPLPAGTQFPTSWPPEKRHLIEFLTRPVARADVDRVLQTFAQRPVTIMVTKDPAGRVGWSTYEQLFGESYAG